MKLPGHYKQRRSRPPEVFVQIECAGCGWRSGRMNFYEAESDYVEHLCQVHYDLA
jgi:hypothetical protein